jgi:hypothetical protein
MCFHCHPRLAPFHLVGTIAGTGAGVQAAVLPQLSTVKSALKTGWQAFEGLVVMAVQVA